MEALTIDLKDARKYGYFAAVLLAVIRLQGLREAKQIADYLKNKTTRQVEAELIALEKKGAIEYIRNHKQKRLAFII